MEEYKRLFTEEEYQEVKKTLKKVVRGGKIIKKWVISSADRAKGYSVDKSGKVTKRGSAEVTKAKKVAKKRAKKQKGKSQTSKQMKRKKSMKKIKR